MNVVAMRSTVENVTEVPPDPDWHDEAVLLSELATLNARIARYVTRMLDADAQRRERVNPADEAALGRVLVELGERLEQRSQHRLAGSATTTAD